VKIAAADYALLRFSQAAPGLLNRLSQWENWLFAKELRLLEIKRPVFICGLARAGSTVLLELLAKLPGVATHRYRDFPFLQIPILWNRYLDAFTKPAEPMERPHQDRIVITRDSPEAMEEPMWSAWFPDIHSCTQVHTLAGQGNFPLFERYYTEHIRKLLFVRHGTRYVAKNNYQVPRIEYLARLFPDAEFIIPIRHPCAHVDSLVRQHAKFCGYAQVDPRVPKFLQSAGHYEFGPQRVPIATSLETLQKTLAYWKAGDEHSGYALQWISIYQLVRELQTHPQLGPRMHVIRHEDLCTEPAESLYSLLESVGLSLGADEQFPSLQHIAARDTDKYSPGLSHIGPRMAAMHEQPLATVFDSIHGTLRREIVDVAKYFGYAL
jgi:hypothetical protein